ncbi:MAG TPA: NAD-dependent epimerase/dehydratase family protein [Candidatus Dormibacteraeota bacterium]|nr:NAD-dependent epimerase/dehydratase family protein [Candidatus Dormibacteraeota bacterium]
MTAPLALVTGASGFVGSHVVDELLRRGARVRCLLRSTSSRRWLEGKPVEIAEGDVCHPEGLDAAVAGADWIVHAAGLTRAKDAAEFHRANVLGTELILGAALGTSPAPRRFLYISSQAAAGPSWNGTPVTEDLEPRPVSTYGSTKLQGETLVMRAADRISVTAIRPPVVYGPREKEFLRYFRTVKCHIRPRLPGTRRFSLVYAVDLARAVWEALTQDRAVGKVYFVGGPDLVSYDETGDEIARALGTWAVPVFLPGFVLHAGGLAGELAGALTRRPPFLSREKIREITTGDWILSSQRIRSELGWSPATSLEQGLRETARWYREAGWV